MSLAEGGPVGSPTASRFANAASSSTKLSTTKQLCVGHPPEVLAFREAAVEGEK